MWNAHLRGRLHKGESIDLINNASITGAKLESLVTGKMRVQDLQTKVLRKYDHC